MTGAGHCACDDAAAAAAAAALWFASLAAAAGVLMVAVAVANAAACAAAIGDVAGATHVLLLWTVGVLAHLPCLVCLREQLPVVLDCTQLVECKEIVV
jgi:hypothetical protein